MYVKFCALQLHVEEFAAFYNRENVVYMNEFVMVGLHALPTPSISTDDMMDNLEISIHVLCA